MYRILIADDSNYMRETLRDILQGAGHEIIAEAINGPNAVEIYKALLPDIVMLDMTMPGESGLETLEKIIRINDGAVVIMLAAVGKPEKVLEALNAGARGYVTKPFDESSILNAIEKAASTTST
ncbi:MAG: response regulator [Clostridiales bacterium]|nr:response regulator [Clostridiales bacterium]